MCFLRLPQGPATGWNVLKLVHIPKSQLLLAARGAKTMCCGIPSWGALSENFKVFKNFQVFKIFKVYKNFPNNFKRFKILHNFQNFESAKTMCSGIPSRWAVSSRRVRPQSKNHKDGMCLQTSWFVFQETSRLRFWFFFQETCRLLFILQETI